MVNDMKYFVIMMLALLPTFIIGFYVYNKDTEREPLNYVLKLFLFGYMACLVSAVCETVIDYFVSTPVTFTSKLFYYFFAIALFEELAKYLFLVLSSYKNKEYDQVYDAVVYSVFIALGFATVENVLYLFANSNYENVMAVGSFRAVLSVPMHACIGVIMGYYITLAKIQEDKKREKYFLASAFLVPFLIHGLFDTLLSCDQFIVLIILLLIIGIIYIFSLTKINELSLNNKKIRSEI